MLYLTEEGQIQSTYTLTPGHVYFIPANHMYDFTTPSWFEKFFIHVRVPMPDGRDFFSTIDEILEMPYDVNLTADLAACLNEDTLDSALRVRNVITSVLERVLAVRRTTVEKRLQHFYNISELNQSIMEYVNTNISQKLKVSDIARQFSVSYTSMANKFKEEVGVALKKYISDRIIEEAQQLLLESDYSIKEIACQLGFTDQYNFSKYFKSLTKHSPTEYRKEYDYYYMLAKKR